MARQKVTRAAGRSMQTTTRRGPGEARRTHATKRTNTTKRSTRRPNPRALAKAQRRAKARRMGNPRE